MSKTVKLAGIAHSKLRNAIGFVGIEVNPIKQEVLVSKVKHWDRNQLPEIAQDVADMFDKFQWSNTIIDLQVGEHLINGLRRASGLPIRVISIKKKVTDANEITRVKSLALIEMVQFMLQLKLAHKIKFPKKPSESMLELESQIALYSEHATEAGGIDYYSPGEELDNLTKALITVTFAARPFMQDSMEITCGPVNPKKITTFEDLNAATDYTMRQKRKIKGT